MKLSSQNLSVMALKIFRPNESPDDPSIQNSGYDSNPQSEYSSIYSETPSRPHIPSPTSSINPASYASMGSVKNMLNADVEVKGKLKFTDDLLIDGIVEGEISSNGTLTVGENARITANIKTKSVIIYGKVYGNITVSDKIELKSTAELNGDVQGRSIAIEAGAIFIGRSEVGLPVAVPTPVVESPESSEASETSNSEKAEDPDFKLS